MSYTMTIESPEKAAWFERERAKMTPAELGELFLAFLAERCAKRQREEKSVMDEFDALAASTSVRRTAPYKFNRADAYGEKMA